MRHRTGPASQFAPTCAVGKEFLKFFSALSPAFTAIPTTRMRSNCLEMRHSPKSAAHVLIMNNRFTDNTNPFIKLTKPKDDTMTNTYPHRSEFAVISDAQVAVADSRVTRTGMVGTIRDWRRDDLGTLRVNSRTKLVSDWALLVGMLLLAADSIPIGVRALVDLFERRLSAESRLRLEIDQSLADPRDDRRFYSATWNAFQRLLTTIDPYPQKEASLAIPVTALEGDELEREQAMRARLDEFSDAFLTMTVAEHRIKVGKVAGKVNIALTDTFLRATQPKPPATTDAYPSSTGPLARGPKPADCRYWSLRRPGGLDSLSPTSGTKPSAVRVPRRADFQRGWEAVIALQVDSLPKGDESFPRLVLSARLHTPGVKLQETSIDVLEGAVRTELTPGIVVADRPYFDGPFHGLGATAAALGYKAIYPYRCDRLGQMGEDENMILVEGSLYHPDMPRPLINATADYLDERIDDAVYQVRLAGREQFVVRPSRAMKKRVQPQLQAFPYGSQAWQEVYLRGLNAAEDVTCQIAAPDEEKSSSLVEAQLRLTMRLVGYNLRELERQMKSTDERAIESHR
jgi:hypothetical protein